MKFLSARWLLLFFLASLASSGSAQTNWDTYGGDAGGQRYSSARQITPANIQQLQPVWTFHTHALDHARMGHTAASFETTPVLFMGSLLLTTPFDEVISIDAETGKQNWRFDPKPHIYNELNLTTSRGVAIFTAHGRGPCSNRAFVGTLDGYLYAVDALTGQPCKDFGDGGRVDAKVDVGWKPGGIYEITSAPLVSGDVVVVGSSIPDSQRVNELRGTVHAYDVHSGKLVWTWDPIASWSRKQPADLQTGAANAWSTMSTDPALGLIYVPTGSASPDHYGVDRPGDNRDANSVVALDAKTGRRVWGFQLVHHDLWDYDVATEPLLFNWHGTTPAVAVSAKPGLLFILDRRTGEPLVPVEERPVPKSEVPGEQASPTQPFSRMPAMNSIDMGDASVPFTGMPSHDRECQELFRGKQYKGIYTPPSLSGSLEYPGSIGGINWGGLAYDPVHQVIYANTNSDVYGVELITRFEYDRRFGRAQGPLERIAEKTGRIRLIAVIGVVLLMAGLWLRGRSGAAGSAVLALGVLVLLAIPLHFIVKHFIVSKMPKYGSIASRFDDYSPQISSPYWMHRKPLADHEGNPCAKLPWGSVTALNLNTLQIQFKVPHGPEVHGQQTGTYSVSGPIVTAGGIVFSAGTRAASLFAYDAMTGQRLSALGLPGPAQATPMTYELNGRQYVVIAAGGHGPLQMVQGDSVVAFALPR